MISKGNVKTSVEKNDVVLLAEVKKVEQLQIASIECIFVDNIFSKICFNDNKSIQVRKSLNEWEKVLPPKMFIRINRSTIINLYFIKQIEKSHNYTMTIYMQSYDKPLILSRSYLTKLKTNLITK